MGPVTDPNNPDSRAIGIAQIMPSTARNPGYGMAGVDPKTLTDPQANLNFAAKYLAARGKALGLQDQDWSTPRAYAVFAAYHGPGTDVNGVNGQQYMQDAVNRMKAGPSWQIAQNNNADQQPQGQPGAGAPSGSSLPMVLQALRAAQGGGTALAGGGMPMQPPVTGGSQANVPFDVAAMRAGMGQAQNGLPGGSVAGPGAPMGPTAANVANQDQFLAGVTRGLPQLGGSSPALASPAAPQQASSPLMGAPGGGFSMGPNIRPLVPQTPMSLSQLQQPGQMPQQAAAPVQPSAVALARAYVTGQLGRQLTPQEAQAVAPVLSLMGLNDLAGRLADYGFAGAKAGAVAGAQLPAQLAKSRAEAEWKPMDVRQGGLIYDPLRHQMIEQFEQVGPDGVEHRGVRIIPLGPGQSVPQGAMSVPGASDQYGGPTSGQQVRPVEPGGAAGGTAGLPGSQFTVPGTEVQTTISPYAHGFFEKRGEEVASNLADLDNTASTARATNFALDNARHDLLGSITPGGYASAKADLYKYLTPLLKSAGLNTDNLDQQLGNYQLFQKNIGIVLRQITREVSGRAAFQEVKLFQDQLPNFGMADARTAGQAIDQLQTLNDYKIAEQRWVSARYGNSPPPANWEQQAQDHLDYRAFLMNRMARSSDGSASLKGLLGNLMNKLGPKQAQTLMGSLNGKLQQYKQEGLIDTDPTE